MTTPGSAAYLIGGLFDQLPIFHNGGYSILSPRYLPRNSGRAKCSCSDNFCASFYTAPKPVGSYGPKHRNLELALVRGMIILDLVDDRIVHVEVLYRDDVRSKLTELFA
jgi:hypothetical protein